MRLGILCRPDVASICHLRTLLSGGLQAHQIASPRLYRLPPLRQMLRIVIRRRISFRCECVSCRSHPGATLDPCHSRLGGLPPAIRARTACSSMGLSNSATRLATSAAAIAPPSHHRRRCVRNVTIEARMPQPDSALAGGRRVEDAEHVRFNPVLWVVNGQTANARIGARRPSIVCALPRRSRRRGRRPRRALRFTSSAGRALQFVHRMLAPVGGVLFSSHSKRTALIPAL